jgi:hypothetical protein
MQTERRAAPSCEVYPLGLSPARTTRVLCIIVGALLGAHVALQAVHYLWHPLPWLLTNLFDVDVEDSFPTWYSASSLLFAAGLFLTIATRKRRECERWAAYWCGLGIGFLILSIDEIAGLHETINTVLPYSWAIPGLCMAAGVGLVYSEFLYRLPRRTGILMAASACIFLGGAAIIEMASDPHFAAHGPHNLSYNLFNAAEEGLEMLGVVLLVYTLLDYMGRGSPVTVKLACPAEGPSPGPGTDASD